MAKNPFGHILSDAFKFLGGLFHSQDSPVFRSSLTQTYTKLLGALSGGDIDVNMDIIIDNIVNLLRQPPPPPPSQSQSPQSSSSQQSYFASAHECVHTVLHTFGASLREVQQQRMTELLSATLKDKRSGEHALIAVLGETRSLVDKIGEASADMQEWLAPLVTALLAHPSSAVRLAAAQCIRTLGAALPSQLASLLRTSLSELSVHSEGLLMLSKPDDIRTLARHAAALRGHGIAIAALIADVDSAPLSVPNSLLRIAFANAKALLSMPPMGDSIAQDARVTSAWAIIAALLSSHKACELVYASLQECILPHISAALSNVQYQKQRKPRDINIFLSGKLGALWAIDAALANNISSSSTTINSSNSSTISNISSSSSGRLSRTATTGSSGKGSLLVTSVLGNLKTLAIELDDLVQACVAGAVPEAGQGAVFMVCAALLKVFGKMPNRDSLASCHSALYGLAKTLVRDGRASSSVLNQMLNRADDALSFWADSNENSSINSNNNNSIADSSEREAGMRCPDISLVWHTSEKETANDNDNTALWRAPHIRAIDEAITVFAQLIALQSEKKQQDMFRDLVAPGPEKSAIRRRNSLVAAVAIMRELGNSSIKLEERGQITKMLVEHFNRFLADSDTRLLRGAAESLGFLCRAAGEGYTAAVVRSLTGLCKDAATTQHAKAGYSLALGCIQRAVGIRSARYLEGTLSTLSSALKDGSPQLQAVALHAFCLAVDAAPSFVPHKTIALLYQLLQSPRHDSAMALRGIGDVINSLIGIVGPELQRGARLMHISNIVNECLRTYPHPIVQLESIRFYQRLIMFAPQAVSAQEIVPLVRLQMSSQWAAVRHNAVTCLRQLVQGAWASQLGVGHITIASRLFEMLDNESDSGLLAEGELVIATLLEKARSQDATQWLAMLCEIVLTTHSTSKSDDDISKDGSGKMSSPSSARKMRGGDGDEDDDDDEDDEDEEEGNSFTTGEKRKRGYDDDDDDNGNSSSNNNGNGSGGGNGNNNSGSMHHEDLSAAAAAAASGAGKPQNELVPRWRTKVFAIKCIHRLLEIIYAGRPETAAHFDSVLAGPTPAEALGHDNSRSSGNANSSIGGSGGTYIVHMIAVLVKVVFFASTSTIDPLRPAGVRLMKDIVEYFGASEDVMARGHKLLELYEAQFASALTRAFSLDAPPETITVACETLAIFILNEISTVSSVPRLTLLLAGFVPTLRKIYFPQYSEWAVTQVQTAIVSGLAKLCLMRLGISPAIKQAINDGLSAHAEGMKSLFVDYIRDYIVLSSDKVIADYHATFFVPQDRNDALPLLEKDWRLVLDALSHILEVKPDLSAQDHALLLGVALRTLQKDVSSVALLASLIHRDYFVRNDNNGNVEILCPEKACEVVLRVMAFERDNCSNQRPIPIAKFSAKLALAIPENYCTSTAAEDPSGISKRCELVRLATLLSVRDPPPSVSPDFVTQLQLAALSYVSLGHVELADPETTATHVGTLLRVCLQWAAACPGRDPLCAQELSKAVVGLVGRRGSSATWVPKVVDAALSECIRIAQEKCGTPLFGTDKASTALTVFNALVVISCTLRTGAADELGFSDETIVGFLAALKSPSRSARLAVLETLRSILQLATTTQNAVPAAAQLLYELGPQLSIATSAYSEAWKEATTDDASEMQEVVKILILAHILSPNKAASIAAVIPPLIALLAPAAGEGTGASVVHEVAFQAVMQLATKFGNDFRGYVGSLDPKARTHVESMMRQSAEAAAAKAKAKAEKDAAMASAKQSGHGKLKPLSLNFSKYKK